MSPSMGDVLLVDPDPNTPAYRYRSAAASDCRQYVSKLISLDERFYNLKVSATGDEVAVTPSDVPVGYVNESPRGVPRSAWRRAGLRQDPSAKVEAGPGAARRLAHAKLPDRSHGLEAAAGATGREEQRQGGQGQGQESRGRRGSGRGRLAVGAPCSTH